MRGFLLVFVQLTLSAMAVGLLLPAVLLAFPAADGPATGTVLAAVLLVVVFVLLRGAWPRGSP